MGEWKEIKLGDILDFISKGTTPPKGVGFVEKGINYVKSDAISYDGRIDRTKFAQIDSGTHEKFKRSHLVENDILFSMAGIYLGKSALVPKDILPANTNQALAILRINKKLASPHYVSYYLRQPQIVEFVNNMSGQSAQPNINFEEIKSIEMLIPPLSEQEQIANIINGIDKKIDLLFSQNKTLEVLGETLFKQWFISEAKDDWNIGKLGDVLFSIESGTRPKGGIDPELKNGIPSIGAESINGIGAYDFSKTKFVTEDFFKTMNRGLIKDYDVLIYKDGAYVGRKGMFGKGFPFKVCTVNEHVFILRCNERANQIFLYFLLQENELAQLNANSAQPGLNQESMKSFEILIPPIEKIMDFESAVKPWVDKILVNSNQILNLTKLRDSLLPKLMSGEVTVVF